MSHHVQLSPAASHRPTAVMDPARHATEPPACRSRCPYSRGQTCAGYCPTLEIRSARPSFTPRQRFPGEPGTGAAGPVRAVCHCPLADPTPAQREAQGHRGQLVRAALCAEPSGQRSASKAHDRDRPACYLAGTCQRPPVDPLRHQAQASPNTTRVGLARSGVRQDGRGEVDVSGVFDVLTRGAGEGEWPGG